MKHANETTKAPSDLAQDFMRMAHPGEYASFDDFMRFADTSIYMSREGNDKYDPNKKDGLGDHVPGLFNFWEEVAHGHYGHIAHLMHQHNEEDERVRQILMAEREEELKLAALAIAKEKAEKEDDKSNVSAKINLEESSFVEKVMFKAGRCVGNICRMTFG
jgi:hypothetical protein